jgi:dephospho-CoA kinase
MKLVGLTGGIATGKSTVASMLRDEGARIIDADELAREIVRPGRAAWREIVAAFGKDILLPAQTLDREKLRKRIFADREARARLESITHPRIRKLARERMASLAAEGAQVAVYEAPLLFENNVHLWLRPVILVACRPDVQKRRLRDRDRLSEEEIRRHLEAQMSLQEKRKLADFVIENDGDLQELRRRVKAVWRKIRAGV